MNPSNHTIPQQSNLVLDHPAGLFVMFFTEMWERFSFYGMRVLLINFLTQATLGVTHPGWGWDSEKAGALFGTYAGLLYLTPLLGGSIGDKFLGYRNAVVIGAFIMTLGHLSMAFDSEISLYLGLTLLIIGTGFFKPNMTSMITELYEKYPQKKDGAFTIFYMGVNAGAFFGMMFCGYLAETKGWAYGFGLAGVFMFLGAIQFWFSKPLFGTIGSKPIQTKTQKDSELKTSNNRFTLVDKLLIFITSTIGLLYLLNDPFTKIKNIHLLPDQFIISKNYLSGENTIILLGLILFFVLIVQRILRYDQITKDRMYALIIFAVFTIFFWMAFEQGATSLVIFARDYTQRNLTGTYAVVYNIINILLTIIPLVILTYVLYLLHKSTKHLIAFSNVTLWFSFLIIWSVAIYMLYHQFSLQNSEVTVSWFSTLNSFFIIAFASYFSKWWNSKYNPSTAYKYAFGLILLGIGFGFLAYGALYFHQSGTTISKVSMLWLMMAYLFHTLGELCLSPVGLSQVSKLVPIKMIAFMYGMWYLAIAIGNKLAGTLGGKIDHITKHYSLSTFFLIFTLIPIIAGIIVAGLDKYLKKKMHGII